jgi:hypothetical protein
LNSFLCTQNPKLWLQFLQNRYWWKSFALHVLLLLNNLCRAWRDFEINNGE